MILAVFSASWAVSSMTRKIQNCTRTWNNLHFSTRVDTLNQEEKKGHKRGVNAKRCYWEKRIFCPEIVLKVTHISLTQYWITGCLRYPLQYGGSKCLQHTNSHISYDVSRYYACSRYVRFSSHFKWLQFVLNSNVRHFTVHFLVFPIISTHYLDALIIQWSRRSYESTTRCSWQALKSQIKLSSLPCDQACYEENRGRTVVKRWW